MWREMALLGQDLSDDDTLRCLVIIGEGPSFSAGIDVVEGFAKATAKLAEMPAHDDAVKAAIKVAGTFNWIPELACPSVAAVRGHAYGGGLQLALACDFRIFSDTALVGLTETRYGLLPDMGATFRLPRIVGEGHARELILLGNIIDSSEALEIGLANRVVPDAELESAVAELANRLAAQPPLAVHGARTALKTAWHDPAASFRSAVEAQLRCFASEDFRRARQTMAEGHPPEWHGR